MASGKWLYTTAMAGLSFFSVSGGTAMAADDTQPAGVEDIVVTARRTAENLQTTPVAVYAHSQAESSPTDVMPTIMLVKCARPSCIPRMSTRWWLARLYWSSALPSGVLAKSGTWSTLRVITTLTYPQMVRRPQLLP